MKFSFLLNKKNSIIIVLCLLALAGLTIGIVMYYKYYQNSQARIHALEEALAQAQTAAVVDAASTEAELDRAKKEAVQAKKALKGSKKGTVQKTADADTVHDAVVDASVKDEKSPNTEDANKQSLQPSFNSVDESIFPTDVQPRGDVVRDGLHDQEEEAQDQENDEKKVKNAADKEQPAAIGGQQQAPERSQAQQNDQLADALSRGVEAAREDALRLEREDAMRQMKKQIGDKIKEQF